MSNTLLASIIRAVAADGFRPHLTTNGLDLEGVVKAGSVSVPARIHFEDLTLATAPRLFLLDTGMLNRKVVPHLDDAGELCVVDRRTHVFDRYRAPEQCRGLIVRAGEVLERGMTKAGTREIAEELASYWSGQVAELPDRDMDKRKDAASHNIGFVTTGATLSFEPHQNKPETLGELLDWAAHWDPKLGHRLLARLAALSPNDPALVIDAPNACLVTRLLMSSKGAKFLGTFKRPGSWERFVKTKAASMVGIERLQGRRIDLATLLAANGAQGKAPLLGRRIVQIGCGAIGGYLARMLVQMGAGIQGSLTLIDPDLLSRQNVRRHQLGMGEIWQNKARACAEEIQRDFPGVTVAVVDGAAQKHETVLASADLIIDVTGEQELGDWLNAWAIARRVAGTPCPPLLFGWIAGHGAAAQSFLMQDASQACYRCLQPDLTRPARFAPLKEAPPEPVAACGDQPSTPYGPAASTAAASLVAAHAGDWAAGRGHHRLRTVRIDWEATVKRDPKSPEPAPDCPACGGQG